MVTALSKLFEDHRISKTYHAVVTGKIENKGTIKTDIKGKKAETDFEVLQSIASDKYKKQEEDTNYEFTFLNKETLF